MNKIKISGDRVTPQEVEEAIAEVKHVKIGKKITVCHLTLKDGHEVIGMSGVVNPENFDAEIGNRVAYDKALDSVWKHMGSILQDRLADEN